MEREWHEASDLRPATAWLLLTLAVGATLRLWHLDQGIPFATGVDEPQIMNRVVHMMKTGDLNPHFFDYPGLVFAVHLPVACARFLAGAIGQRWSSLEHVSAIDFYVWGRVVTAIFGVATILVVHQIGMRWGARHALLAAGLFAVMPLHVRESRFVLTDVPMTFFVALTLLLSLKAHESRRMSSWVLAGAAAGLATGTKYPGGLTLIFPLLAAWLTYPLQPSRLACAGAAAGAWLVAFLAVAPYTILDLPGFLNGFAALTTAYGDRAYAESGFTVYLKHLLLNFRWPAMIAVAYGFGLGVIRAVKGPGQVRWTLLLIFPPLFFYTIAGRQLIFGRYLLPIVPALSVIAACGIISGVSLLRRFNIPRAVRTSLIVALTVAVVLPPLLISWGFAAEAGKLSTKGQTYRWLLANVPPGTGIAVEGEAMQVGPLYRYVPVRRIVDRSTRQYAGDSVKYLITSSEYFGPVLAAPEAFADEFAAYMTLFRGGQEVVRFPPSPDHPGPELRVIEVR